MINTNSINTNAQRSSHDQGSLLAEPVPLMDLEDQVVSTDDQFSNVSNVSHKEYAEHNRYVEAELNRLTTLLLQVVN